MKILIDIGHPAHVHLFRNLILKLQEDGNEIKITARNKEITLNLLDYYNLDYTLISIKKDGFLESARELFLRSYRLMKIAKNFKPNIMVAVLDPSIAQAGCILGIPTITFTDSEPEAIKYPFVDLLTLPFTNAIIVPSSVRHFYGKKEVRVRSYKELAYLHPNYFKPNFDTIENAGIQKNEDYVLLRFINFHAYHDVGKRGFNLVEKRKLIKNIEKYAKVFISAESSLPHEFDNYRLPISPEKIHDFLYYAKLLICDSQTMTTEAGVLGTPAVRYNSFVGNNDMGNFVELEQKYNLIFNYSNSEEALSKSIELIRNSNLKNEWKSKREQLLKDKIDLTAYLIWFVEHYPESFYEVKKMPELSTNADKHP